MSTATISQREEVYNEVKRLVESRMESQQTDLLIDQSIINKHPEGTPFIHWTRRVGTHIEVLPPVTSYPAKGVLIKFLCGQADREHLLRQKLEMAECLKNSGVIVAHHYDGNALHEVSLGDALKVVQAYATGIRNVWLAEKGPEKKIRKSLTKP